VLIFTCLSFPGFLFTLLPHFFPYALKNSRFFLFCRFWQYNVTRSYERSSRVSHLFSGLLRQWLVTGLFCSVNQICNCWIKNRAITFYPTPLTSRESLVKVIKPQYNVIVIFQLEYSLRGIDINFNADIQICVYRIDMVSPLHGRDTICKSARRIFAFCHTILVQVERVDIHVDPSRFPKPYCLLFLKREIMRANVLRGDEQDLFSISLQARLGFSTSHVFRNVPLIISTSTGNRPALPPKAPLVLISQNMLVES
jgi:hypothetical protein